MLVPDKGNSTCEGTEVGTTSHIKEFHRIQQGYNEVSTGGAEQVIRKQTMWEKLDYT